MGISSPELTQLTAKYVENFLKGLSLCGMIGNYTIQFLEVSHFTSKEEDILQSYIIQLSNNLQSLLKTLCNTSLKYEVDVHDQALDCSFFRQDVSLKEIELFPFPDNKLVRPDNSDFKRDLCSARNNESPVDIFETFLNSPTCASILNENKGARKASSGKAAKYYSDTLNTRNDSEKVVNENTSDYNYISTLLPSSESLPQDSVMANYLHNLYPMNAKDNGTANTGKEDQSVLQTMQPNIDNVANNFDIVDYSSGKADNLDYKEIMCSRENEFNDDEFSDQYSTHTSEIEKILDFKVENNEVILSVNTVVEDHNMPVIKTKRVSNSVGEQRCSKSETSQTIFADIVKLGPSDLNGHPWCEICEKEFPSSGSLKRHLTSSHTKVLWCHTCLKAVNSKNEMKKHILEHHIDLANVCLICGKSFKSPPSLQRHVGVHKGCRGTACEICGQTFSRSEYHKEHMRVHTGEKPFECQVCKKNFSKSSNLATHMVIHKPRDEGHICSMCYKVFRRQDKLKEHTMRHLKIKRFICKLCPKAYSEKRDLTKHLNKIHTFHDPKSET